MPPTSLNIRNIAINLSILLLAISKSTMAASNTENLELAGPKLASDSNLQDGKAPTLSEADVDSLSLEVLNTPDSHGRTALLRAIHDYNMDLAVKLIKRGVGLDASGDVALYLAIVKGQVAVVECLAEYGVCVVDQVMDPINFCPLMEAISRGNFEIAALLVKNGANVDVVDPITKISAVDLAIRKGSSDILKLLIDRGAPLKLEILDNRIHSKTIQALMSDQTTKMVDLLVHKFEFDLNVIDSDGDSALHRAIKVNNVNMIKYLIDKGVNLDVNDHYKIKPLNYAIGTKRFDASKLLIEAGATVSEIDQQKIMKFAETDNQWSSLIRE